MPDVHAHLSASGSHVWMNCPPAIELSKGIQERYSEFAAEGTLAHSMAEAILSYRFGMITQDDYEGRLHEIESSSLYAPDMGKYITNYADWVEEIFNGIEAEDKELLTEQRLDFSAWVPGGFGTGDVVIIADNVLTVIDLKYGRGVPVDADHNSQLMLYGLGAYDSFSLSNDFENVRMYINQPRLDSISMFEISVKELLEWAENEVKPKAEAAMLGKGDAVPGNHCRFCKVRQICRARADYIKAVGEKRDPRLLSDQEIADLLGIVDDVASFVTDLKDYAKTEAVENKKKWPGWKLVEGRSLRKFTDTKAVEERLTANGFAKVLLYKDPELLGITAMEKVVGGKKKLETLCEGLITKPPGAPTLVPESDKRPELNGSEVYDDDYNE